MNIKIIGSGSAGNHMAFALEKFVKRITLTDVSLDALKRSKNKIYIPRYKKWSKKINQVIENKDVDRSYDAIVIASPPNTHLSVLKKNILKVCTKNPAWISDYETALSAIEKMNSLKITSLLVAKKKNIKKKIKNVIGILHLHHCLGKGIK